MPLKKYFYTPLITWVTAMKHQELSTRDYSWGCQQLVVAMNHHGSGKAFVIHSLDAVMEEPGERYKLFIPLFSLGHHSDTGSHRQNVASPELTGNVPA